MDYQKIILRTGISIIVLLLLNIVSSYECNAQEKKKEEISQTNNNQTESKERSINSGDFEELKKVCNSKIDFFYKHISSLKTKESLNNEVYILEERISKLHLMIQRYEPKIDTNWVKFEEEVKKEIEEIENSFSELNQNDEQK